LRDVQAQAREETGSYMHKKEAACSPTGAQSMHRTEQARQIKRRKLSRK